ncbi:uncharacterized protein LOC125677582 [Ostrea edulis]|uniref:uncharacterized protein LOC125677582 n=1 Tax=Ostrea edulis TaxID=37623 RepID=UPI0024AFA593|nr:uncharacterized protein LOC125677582 [Ostrea edulis]
MSQLVPNINYTNTENQKLESSPEKAVLLGASIAGAISVSIPCLILIVYGFCKDRKYHSLNGIFSSLLETKCDSHTPRQTDINVQDNGDKLEDERFTEEHPLTVDIVQVI